MGNKLTDLLKLLDFLASRCYLRFFTEKNSLIIFNFHILFHNDEEIALNHVDPQLGMTVEHFRGFVEYFMNNEYIFVSPDDILKGLDVDKRYVMVTFDDGYFNNQNVLPVLKKHQVPAVFFISVNHIKYNKCFWWDVLFRERFKQGSTKKDIWREQNHLKSKKSEGIEKYLKDRFGEGAFNPKSDIDRPFSPLELKDFSKEKYVFIGNHSCDHSILTNYSSDEIRSELLAASDSIFNITGGTPLIVSYPDGAYSDEIIRISKEAGFKLGVTTDFKKNYLPIDCKGDDCMRLGRFDLGDGNRLVRQCELFRSDISLYAKFFNLLYKSCRSL